MARAKTRAVVGEKNLGGVLAHFQFSGLLGRSVETLVWLHRFDAGSCSEFGLKSNLQFFLMVFSENNGLFFAFGQSFLIVQVCTFDIKCCGQAEVEEII